jgi:hypothetical protein
LKLAHYVKIPPRQTFMAQMAATFLSTIVCIGVLNFQMNNINNVCTPDAQYKLTCPGVNTFFTASVLWGTVGPQKIFGHRGQYSQTLVGFPLGVILVFLIWGLNKKFPKWTWARQLHPVVILYGGIVWAPYNMSYVWPSVPIAYFSWIYLKTRYLGLWSKVSLLLFPFANTCSPTLLFCAASGNTDNDATVQLRPLSSMVMRHCHLGHHHLLQLTVHGNQL